MPPKFQLCSKNLFLTYPQTSFSLEQFKDNVLKLFEKEGVDKLLVATEKHQDGNDHIHAVICLQKQLRTTKQDHFDELVQPAKHPNIVSRLKGGLAKTLEYVMKDGNWLAWPDSFRPEKHIKQSKSKKSTKSDTISERLLQGAKIKDLIEDEPGFVMMNLRKLQEFSAFLESKERQTSRAAALSQECRVKVADGHSTSSTRALASWLNKNLRNPSLPRRRKQLWLQAPPQAGKTTMIENLTEWFQLSVYFMPKDEQWNDLYEDGEYDLVLLDEYKGQKTIQFLNSWLSNDPQPVSRRGKAPIVKRDALPFIILSNLSPREVYHKCSDASFDALMSRLKLIKLEENELIRLEKDVPLEPESDPNEDDSHLPVHDFFSTELPPPPPPLPEIDPLDAYLCSTDPESPTGEYLLSSEYRNEARKRITRAEEAQRNKSKPSAVKRMRTRSVYRFFDEEASASDKEDESDSQPDAFDLTDPFIDDSEQ